MQVADGVDDDEDKEEHRGARQADAVVRKDDVLLRHDGEEDLLHEAQDHVAERAQPASDLALALHPHLAVLLVLRPVARLAVALVQQGRRGPTDGCCRDGGTGADLADDGVRRVLRDHIRRVDHVELLCGVLACEGQDGQLSARVIAQEAGDVEHLAVHHDPAVSLRVVLGHISQRVPTTAASNWRGSRSRRTAGLVHRILVGAPRELGALDLAGEAAP
mmetsp:Transcript_84168/g.235796  ORF Transcript_84168/g.235796 Transcript_84168/m.235796 type:complete len:219 (-) Transcript_84168:88-744(-)